MADSIGKKLCQARLERGLTIDEAAHATKLRPDKVMALENEDYARFPSNAYAKGFLLIYGRFLKVDVAAHADALDTSNTISIGEYQYLSTASEPRLDTHRDVPDLRKRRAPSVMPLLAFFGLLLAGLFIFTAFVNWKRITGETPRHKELPFTAAAVNVEPVASAPEPPEPPAQPAAELQRVAMSDRDFLSAAATPAPAAHPPAATPDSDIVTAAPVQMNEVEVAAVRKTWVAIRQDDPKSLPVFEDYLYPSAPPLKLQGTRFLIEARDPAAVEIRKNGAPIAYQSPGVTVQ